MKFAGIEVGRGIASCLVAAYHASRIIAEPRYAGRIPFGGSFGEFHVGVDFFFVLSGFLISWVHWSDLGRPDRVGRYFLRRFTRIYPAYWAVLLPLIAIHFVHPAVSHVVPMDAGNILTSLFLLPSATTPLLGVAWTLVYEVFFYILFGVVIVIGPKGLGLLVLWAAAVLLYFMIEGAGTFPLSFFLGPYNLEFLFGIVIAKALKSVTVPYPRLLAAAGAIMFFSAMLDTVGVFFIDDGLAMRLIFGIPAGMIIIGMVEAERSNTLKIPFWLQSFGAASYAIYLVHAVVEPAALSILWPYVSRLSPEILTLFFASIGIVAGIIFHHVIERPLTVLVRNLLARGDAVPG